MKFNLITIFLLAVSLHSLPVVGQSEKEPEGLGLPGDNLDLYAVLDIFQKSKTIEDFEKTLNDEKTAVNNLDLNLDNKVDFIKVVTEQEGNDFSFILQVPVSEKETQDVAVILVSKDDKGKVTMQIVGDKDLYGKDYIIEPQTKTTPASTVNPGYTGDDPLKESTPATTQVVVVESAPIVKYVYSPVYVPYYPPYYYGYYPPYYNPFVVPIAFGIYWSNHYHYHGYGYGHTHVVHHHNHYHNHYHNHRNYSNTVAHNRESGNYRNNVGTPRPSTGASPSTRPSTGASGNARPSTGATTRPSAGTTPSTRPSTSTKPSTGASPSTRPSTSPSTRPSTSPSTKPSTTPSTRPSTSPSTKPSTSPSTRPSTSPSTRPSSSSSMGASRTMNSGSGYSGASRGGYSGSSRGGGYSGGGRRR